MAAFNGNMSTQMEVLPSIPVVYTTSLSEGEMTIDNQVEVSTQKGNDMDIYMFMSVFHKNVTTERGTVLKEMYNTVITTTFKDAEEEVAYWASVKTHSIVNGILAVDKGEYRFRLMEELVACRGFKFRALMIESKDLKHLNGEGWANTVTMSWASDSKAVFLKLYRGDAAYCDAAEMVTEFGLAELGLTAEYVKKITKRFQEILRSSEMNIFIASASEYEFVTMAELSSYDRIVEDILHPNGRLVIGLFNTPDELVATYGKTEADKLFDGTSVVDAQVVLRSLYEQVSSPKRDSAIRRLKKAIANIDVEIPFIDRYMIRILFNEGLIKGDVTVMVGLKEFTGADILSHSENLKSELSTDGYLVLTMDVHHPRHVTTLDSQSMANLPKVFTNRLLKASMTQIREQADSVITSNAPDWLKYEAPEFDAPYGIRAAANIIAEERSAAVRWQTYNSSRSIDEGQNFGAVYMTGIDKKMTVFVNKENGLNKKPWLPAPNACSLGVMANATLLYMVGFDAGAYTGITYVEGVGMVYPDHRWLECYELAGGQDQDDHNNVMAVKVYCDSVAMLANLQNDGVIDPDIAVPSTKEDAVNLVLVWRMPNGKGEYSIQRTICAMPFFNVNEDAIQTINLADMPRGQKHLLAQTRMLGLPTDNEIVYSAKESPIYFNRDHAKYIISAQALNPGIGSLANALMVWHDTMGDVYPPVMLDKLEELIDAVQAGHDKVSIDTVSKAAKSILIQLAKEIVKNSSLKTDRLLVTERLRYTKGEFMKVLRGAMEDGRPTKLSNEYMRVNREIKALIKATLLQKRAASDLFQVVSRIGFNKVQADGTTVMEWAQIHFKTYKDLLGRVDREFAPEPRDPKFLKIAKSMARSARHRELVGGLVEDLKSDPALTDARVLALYKFAIRSTNRWPLGTYDRVVFQTSGQDEAAMDLLAIAYNNLMERRAITS